MHVHFGDEKAAKMLARKINEKGAGTVEKYPDKFGLLASLALPKEILENLLEIVNVSHLDHGYNYLS